MKKVKSKIFLSVLFLAFLSSSYSNGQAQLFRDTSIVIETGGKSLPNAWTGGFNAPIFADMELNGDGTMDLIVFDWLGANVFRIYCFVNNRVSIGNIWSEAPQYEKLFPVKMEGWMRTYDYDCDGDLDLFTYDNGGLAYYKNNYSVGGGLNFTQTPTNVITHYGSFPTTLYSSRVDMPALTDLENDGDMDILSFSISGNFLENNKNLSQDSSLICGSLNYIYNVNGCWGYFTTKSGSNSAVLPLTVPPLDTFSFCKFKDPADPFRMALQVNDANSGNRHSGSATLALDIDNDGDQDVIMGDIGGTNLLYIENCGTPDSAFACSSDSIFPNYNVPAILPLSFPAAYYFDADNDNKKDIIAANFERSGDDYNNVWYYQNTGVGSNIFTKQTDRFLANTMVDVGTSAHPVLADINGDGLKDLIIGNDRYSVAGVAKLSYYKNIGIASKAKFMFITDDLAGLSASGATGLYPTFADLDGDNDVDMLVGEDGGSLLYFQNTGTSSNPIFTFIQANYQSINVTAQAAPQLIDVDRDGKIDLIIGNRTGKLSYYRNTSLTGTPPVFTLIDNNFGGVNVIRNGNAGFSAPCLFDVLGSYELLVGSESGYLYHYKNIDGHLTGTFLLEDSLYQNIYEPSRCVPTVADLDGDSKYDLIVGNIMGGVVLYTQNPLLSVINQETPSPFFTCYPNPVSNTLYIKLDNQLLKEGAAIEIFDVLGKSLVHTQSKNSQNEINVENFRSGTYLCRVTLAGNSFSQRFIKK